MAETTDTNPGYVYLVGAGPGDPRLLTLRAAECLGKADVVLYDYLVNPRVLEHLPAGAEKICLGRHGRQRVWSQDEINQALVQWASKGKTVVRLKGGDPAVFACGAQEAQILADHHLPFEIVPGITAALAAGSSTGIPITHRDMASAVALVTGHEQPGKPESAIDYAALAKFPGTLVFYMGTTTVRNWSQALMSNGKSPDTPVAVVRRCSLPDQLHFQCTLGELADRVESPTRLRPPVIFIIGDVVQLGVMPSWVETKPLMGRRILVTRPADQQGPLQEQLEHLGASVWRHPAITITPPDDWTEVDQAIDQLDQFDWLVFASANGVRFFLDRLLQRRDLRALGHLRLAAVGPGTANQLGVYRLNADVVPPRFDADSLASELTAPCQGRRVLSIRANRGRQALQQVLAQAGAEVRQVLAYQSLDVEQPETEILDRMQQGEFDWVTVTSSAIASSLIHLFKEALHQSKLASLSPAISQKLRDHGFQPAVEARQSDLDHLIQAMVQHESAD